VAEGWRRSVLRAARAVGSEPVLRQLQRLLASPQQRRDARDLEHMRLVMRLCLPVDANCVDVGANVGDVLREMVAIAPRGRHVAFEPLPDVAADLGRRFPQVDVHNAAAGGASGEASFYRVKSSHSRSSLSPSGLDAADLERLVVRVEALDEVLGSDYAPALIKIDVEGAERATLLGAQRLLERHRPIVIFEHGASAQASDTTATADIHQLLTKIGYRIFDIDGTGPLTQLEFEVATTRGKVWTFVAHA
jgi:FkbM family methyltransferase